LAVGCVDTGVVGILGVAGLKDVVLSIVGSVVGASDSVEDMLAIVGRVGASGVTGFEAEGIGTYEVGPLDHLNVSTTATERVGEHDTSHRVTTEISTVGVHLTTVVIRRHVEFGLVDEAHGLDVVRGLQELDTSQGASGNETGTVARLAAPGNHLAFDFTDGLSWSAGGPKTEVI